MKYFVKFDDETMEEARGEGTPYDSVNEAVEDVSGFIGEDQDFEIYNSDGMFKARYVWSGGTPIKSNLPRGKQ